MPKKDDAGKVLEKPYGNADPAVMTCMIYDSEAYVGRAIPVQLVLLLQI
jgi:hypothetical protein